MAQNLNEALLRLELEVIGADAIKAAARAVEEYGAATKRIQPARVETIIGAIDLATPVYKKAAASIKELAEVVRQNAAMIKTNLQTARQEVRLFADELENLGVPSRVVARSVGPVHRQVLGAVTSQMGLLPADVEAISRSDRLYRGAGSASRDIDRMGSQDPVVAAEARLKAFKATRDVARLAPVVLGGGILENPNYKLIASAASAAHVDAGDLQQALANLAPLIAQQRLLDTYRAALRLAAGQILPREPITGQHPLFQTRRQGFGPLEELAPDLEQAALLLATTPQLVARGLGFKRKRRLSPLDLAQILRRREFDLAEGETAELFQTGAGRERTKELWPGGPLVSSVSPGGRYLDYLPGPTTLFRPREDVRAIAAGPMQPRRLLPPTAIETTAREVGPMSPGIASIMSAAEAAVLQGRGMVPERTQWEMMKTSIRRRMREALEPGGTFEGLGKYFLGIGNEFGMATVGRSRGGSISQQAIEMLEGYGRPTIFPKTFSKMLNISPEAGSLLINSLQQQGYLGQPGGTGLASGLPIIGAQTRRSKQAEAEANLTEATIEEARQRRINVRQAAKLAVAQEQAAAAQGASAGGGGGTIPPDEEEEIIPGVGGRGGKGKPPKTPPKPPPGPFGRFAGRFTGLSYYLTAAAVLYPVMSALSQADQSAKELQTIIQRIQGIYGSHTLGEQLEIKQGIVAAAQKYGESLTEVATAAERFAQAQEPMKNIGLDLQTAAAGSKAFGTNMQQIAEFMIGIQEATGGKTTGAQAVNLVAALSRQGVVSPMSLMTAMQQLTPITQELFAEPSGAVTDPALIGSILKTVSQRTGMSGTTVTNAMRYMFARFKGPTAGNIEELSGVNLGTLASQGQELRPVAEILRDIAAAYKHLLETGRTEKATELLTLLFGPRQIGPGATFLESMPEILKEAMKALRDTGATAERASVQMDSLETAQKRLHNSLTTAWGEGMLPIRTGIDNFIAKIIEAVDWLLKADVANEKWWRDAAGPAIKDRLTGPVVPGATINGIPVPRSNPFAPEGLPSPKSTTPSGWEEFFPGRISGPGSNKPEQGGEVGVGTTPSEAVYQKPPLRNMFAEMMTKGGISLQAQMRRAQIAVIAEQTQTAVRMSTMLRQAQGRSTIGLELQGIEAGRLEQGGINQATFTEQLKLYQTDYARIAKEISDAQKNKKYPRQERDAIIIPLQEERLALNAKVALLFAQYYQEQKILDVKTEQTKQSAIQIDQTRQLVEKLRELGNIGRIAQDFFVHGLQGVAQALGSTGPGRGGRAATAFLGAAAGGIGGIMSQGLDMFGPQGAFPGVGKFLYSKLGKPSEADITAQAKAMAPAIQARFPGMSLITATELAKKAITDEANRKQALTAIGQIGGEIAGSAIGKNAQGAQIGSTIGAGIGSIAIPGPAGGLVGGFVGGIIGGLFGGNKKPPPEVGSLKIIEQNTGEQVRLLENTNKLLEANFVSFNVPTGFRLPSYQPGFLGGIAASRGAGGGGVVNSSINVAVNIGGTNVSADKLGSTIAQAISDRLELESRSSGGYFPRLLYG